MSAWGRRQLQQAHDAAYQRWTPAKNKGAAELQ